MLFAKRITRCIIVEELNTMRVYNITIKKYII